VVVVVAVVAMVVPVTFSNLEVIDKLSARIARIARVGIRGCVLRSDTLQVVGKMVTRVRAGDSESEATTHLTGVSMGGDVTERKGNDRCGSSSSKNECNRKLNLNHF